MIEKRGDIFKYILRNPCDGLFITTNGFVKSNGECVMGRGIAKQISTIDPTIPRLLGSKIKRNGNIVQYIKNYKHIKLYSFPVKPDSQLYNGYNTVSHMDSKFNIGDTVPGWACLADLSIIKESVEELQQLTLSGAQYIIPRPGCGAGELVWSDVKPILQELDDRFIVMTY